MPALNSKLRSDLDTVCQKARDKAEEAARSALKKRAVDAAEPHSHFTPAERELRNRLRARGRQVGDVRQSNKKQTIDHITQELAYEYWHRMLFARFLAENHLLMHPDGVAVSLEECEELAASEGATNGFVLAARYASTMLPQVFRTDDVLLEIEFAPEHRLALEKLLASLPRETFLADDSLGWVYQFWQTKRKKEVNESGDKIDGDTLPAVTQLFTDDYMVQFLLQNTIGAWWCAKEGITGPPGGAGVPAGQCPVEMPYLRWREDGTPAAGSLEGWPKTLAEFTMLDPCCGSGHFIVNGFNLLVPLRMHDEGLSAEDACDAVLSNNLFGLELDPRCTQIAAFALAIAAWTFPSEIGEPLGFRALPRLKIACSGQDVTGRKEEWIALANGNTRLAEGMSVLYDLFDQAPHLGSLIDPKREAGDLLSAGFSELKPLLTKAQQSQASLGNVEALAIGVAAQGIAEATEILAGMYTLVITNVPYLGRGDQADVLYDYSERFYSRGKGDIATVFLLRCLEVASNNGTVAIVTPWNWLFLTTYSDLRLQLLKDSCVALVARLGEKAFESPQAAGAFAALNIIHNSKPSNTATLHGLDVSKEDTSPQKALHLIADDIHSLSQATLLENPDYVISTKPLSALSLLGAIASCFQGTSTGDNPRFVLTFWEIPVLIKLWQRFQVAPESTIEYGGRQNIIRWNDVVDFKGSAIRGDQAWKRKGVAIGQMRSLPATLYCGDKFSNTTPVIVPNDPDDVPMLWHFCQSSEFFQSLRDLNPKLSVDNGYVSKIGIDVEAWRELAYNSAPITSPSSSNPNQWLFDGNIVSSDAPLQTAVALLLGYRWPQQAVTDADTELSQFVDQDGIVCIPAVRGEKTASERLLELLHAAYKDAWSQAQLAQLLQQSKCKPGTTVESWLRNSWFDQHLAAFGQKPFVWHVWDGRKDGFSCLINYHKLSHKSLENLTYAYLGDWINVQNGSAKSGRAGADLRLAAAQELQDKLILILEGKPPYDIFVRWKPLHEQAIGWNPDLNDGVRMNIRPFVEAGILRKTPNIKWTKDRGKEQKRPKDEFSWFWDGSTFKGERVNDIHLTIAEKQAAREAKGVT